jgi:hypothetical protein
MESAFYGSIGQGDGERTNEQQTNEWTSERMNQGTKEQFRTCTKRSECVDNERNGSTREITQLEEMAVSASWNRYQQNERR